MKKVKGLLLFGILTLFFGLSFGYDGNFTMFHNVSSDFGVSNVPFVKYRQYSTIHSNIPNYYSVSPGTQNFWGTFYGRTLSLITNFPQDIIPFEFSFYSPKGFSISGNNSVIFSLIPSTYSFLGSRLYNSNHSDTYPLIFSDSQDYLTFNNETTLAYNGQTYNYGNYGLLKYCFYGVNFDLSCVFSSSDGYNLVNFSYDLDNDKLFVSSGFLIVPLSVSTDVICNNGNSYCSSFTGTSSLILIDVDDVIYWNIVNCYGSNSIFNNSCSVLSKGYINGLSSSQFFGRSFLTLEGGGTIQNGLGYFSEIFYDSGNFYYRSNSVKTSFSSGAPYNYLMMWLAYSTLDLQNSDSVPNILDYLSNGGGNGNQSSFSGIVFLNNCIDTQICYDSTGLDGTPLRICSTECVSSGVIASGGYFGLDGTFHYVGSNYNVGNVSNSDGIIFDSGYVDSDGILSGDYFLSLFNGDGFHFGVCPYPSSNMLGFVSKVNIGNIYPFMPLDCAFSAFLQGYKVHYFDDFLIFPDLTSQLISGDTDYHKTLFRFFDVCLSFGVLFFCLSLYRLVKK